MFDLFTKKQCTKCKKRKPLNEFSKKKHGPGGLNSWCFECNREYNRKYKESNFEKERERKRKWREDNCENERARTQKYREDNIEKIRERKRKWRENNREYVNECARKYRAQNLGRVVESVRKWLKANPEKATEYYHNRRARVEHNGGTFTAREWRELKERHKYTCLRCGKREPEIKLAPDHVLPLAKGGANIIENIQPLCRSCNSKKHAKHIDYRPTSEHS